MHQWNEEQGYVEFVELTDAQRQRQDTAAAHSTWVCQSLEWLETDQPTKRNGWGVPAHRSEPCVRDT